jgi:hypothetical protein
MTNETSPDSTTTASSVDGITDEELATLRAYVDTKGLMAAVRLLRIDREALTRVLARLSVRRGTIALVRVGLPALIAARAA